MAITVAVVMAAPVVADGGLGSRHAIAVRSLHRLMGCLLGGIAALGCLALDVTSFPWWLAMIGGGVWIGMHIQMGPHGVGYVGTQAAFVFIVTMIQGAGAAHQHLPGIDRFAGIAGGLGILWIVSLLLWPSERSPRSRSPERSRQRTCFHHPMTKRRRRSARLSGGEVTLGSAPCP